MFPRSIVSESILHSTHGWKVKIALNWNPKSNLNQTSQMCNFRFLFYISKRKLIKVSGFHSCIFGNRKFINYIFQLHFTFIKVSHKRKSSNTPEEIFYYITSQELLMFHCEIFRRNMRFLWEKALDIYLNIFNSFWFYLRTTEHYGLQGTLKIICKSSPLVLGTRIFH